MSEYVYVIIGIRQGCLEDVKVFKYQARACAERDKMLPEYGLTLEDIPDNQHWPDCRWNDENEVHLHRVTPNVSRRMFPAGRL